MNYDNNHSIQQCINAIFSMNNPGRSKHGDSSHNGNQPAQNEQTSDQSGPPDLDELWRDFNSRLNRLFRRGDNSNRLDSGTGRQSGKRRRRVGIGIAIGVLAAIYASSGIFIVQEGQAAVVLRFGKYQYIASPGIQWRLPYPFESDEVVNLSQVRSVEIGRSSMIRSANLKDSSMLTEDENIIDMRFTVQYRVKEPADFLFNVVDPESSVTQAAETAVREIVGKNKMDYVLYEGREQVGQQLTGSIQRILDWYRTGILVTSVTVQSVQPPEQVQAAFDDAVKATQDRERQKNEAQAYANDVIPRARGDAARMISEAQGYNATVIAQAQGNAERFKQIYTEYAKAPEVTRKRMYLDTMQQIFSNTSKVLVDNRRGNNNLLYLPLDKIVEQNKTRVGAQPDAATAPVPAPAPTPDSPSADTARPGGMPAPANTDEPLRSRELLRDRSRRSDMR